MIYPGSKVKILYPEYAAGRPGIVLALEILKNGSESGYWLVKVQEQDIILALSLQEIEPME
ncbi:MAG: hypothetical protein F6K30_25220 [Cyanothece sp. SIO2G6]|nr:hypothetical protein [Cyanothece sp. SIO2G6]